MGVLDELEEAGLELDRDLLGNVGKVADRRDERGLGRLEGEGIDTHQPREVVADGGAVEALGGVELVTLLDGVGEALQQDRHLRLHVLLGGSYDEFLGECDAAAGRTGGIELLDDLVLNGDRGLAQDVALGLLLGDGDARVLGHGLLRLAPPLLEFVLADDLGQGDLKINGGGGVVRVALQGLDHELRGVLGDQFGYLLGFRLLTDEKVLVGKHVHGGHAEGRVHRVPGLSGEVDHQLLSALVVALDLSETPAAMHHVGAWLHGLQFGFGRLEGRVLGDERGDDFGIHKVGPESVS